MSRAYRVSVSESLRTVLRAQDKVTTQLELLEVLPAETMAELLARELESRGFVRDGKNLVREEKGVQVTVNSETGEVTVSAESSRETELKGTREGRAWDDMGPNAKQVREELRKHLGQELEKQAEQKTARLQGEVTDRLEQALGDIRQELDQAVNRVTAEALKQKAATLGQIKELHEDKQTGNLTIVLEV